MVNKKDVKVGSSMRIRKFLWRHGLKPWHIVHSAAALGLLVAITGCSADISRFDFPALGVNGNDAPTSALNGPRPVNGSQFGQQPSLTTAPIARGPSVAARTQDVEVAALPEPSRAPTPPSYGQYEPTAAPVARVPAPITAPRPQQEIRAAASGKQITVESGDTLYGLARRHGVKVSALMEANNLPSSALKPGQSLVIPGEGQQVAAAPRAEVAPSRSAASGDWTGEYTIRSGDSLYRIARQFGVKSSELQQYNNISDPRRLRLGTVLRVPARGDAGNRSATYANRVAPNTAPRRVGPPALAPRSFGQNSTIAGGTSSPTILNGKKTRVASLDRNGMPKRATPPVTSRAGGSAPSSTAKLLWPVNGKVIDGFGRRGDGTHNDGVNVSVPAGTPVNAADDGVIAYAGSELKGYGNLILVRHDNGWVTAYAHNQSILVKRGDKVRRGQPIAKAGQTGQVDRPQVHFELRKGAKPVDPLPYLNARS